MLRVSQIVLITVADSAQLVLQNRECHTMLYAGSRCHSQGVNQSQHVGTGVFSTGATATVDLSDVFGVSEG